MKVGLITIVLMILIAQNISLNREINDLKMEIASLHFNMSDQDELDDLTDRVDQVESQYYDLENEVQNLESEISNLQFQMW